MSPVRLHCLGEEVENVAALQTATGGDGHDAPDVARAARRLRAETGLAPDDEAAQRALGQIVGRLHARRADKRPQCRAPVQDVAAGARRLGMAAVGALLQQGLDALAQKQNATGEHVAAQGAVPHPMPEAEHAPRAEEQFIPDPSRFPAALGHLREVAQQMRPAQLPVLRIDPGIGRVAVRHQDAGETLAQRGLGRLRTACGRGEEHGDRAGHNLPHPVVPAAFLVPGLVGMRDAGLLHMGVRLAHDAVERGTDLGFALADGADRQIDAEQIGEQTLHLSLGQTIGAGERADHCQQARAGHATGNAGRQSGFAGVTTDTASAGKQPAFSHHWLHRRQVDDLMPGTQAGNLHRAAAGGARSGAAVVCVRDLFGRQQYPCLAGMAALGTA